MNPEMKVTQTIVVKFSGFIFFLFDSSFEDTFPQYYVVVVVVWEGLRPSHWLNLGCLRRLFRRRRPLQPQGQTHNKEH